MGLARCGLLRVAGLPVEGMSVTGEVLRERGGGSAWGCHEPWTWERERERVCVCVYTEMKDFDSTHTDTKKQYRREIHVHVEGECRGGDWKKVEWGNDWKIPTHLISLGRGGDKNVHHEWIDGMSGSSAVLYYSQFLHSTHTHHVENKHTCKHKLIGNVLKGGGLGLAWWPHQSQSPFWHQRKSVLNSCRVDKPYENTTRPKWVSNHWFIMALCKPAMS